MSDSEQDKKRNKLGYQRISIACAHCRRRKIRCLLADKDPQGRCQNCIRLKKECVFYPIDQQTAYESRSDQGSGSGVGSASSSGVSSTSPDIGASHGTVRRSAFQPMPDMSQAFPGMPLEPSATYQGHYLPVERAYAESLPSNSPWLPTASRGFEAPAQTRHQSPASAQFWGYEQSPGSGDFAPFPNDLSRQVHTPSTALTATFPQSSPMQQWQPQQTPHAARSMTYPLPASSVATNLPHYASSDPQLPPASYPPFSAPTQSPSMMGQMQGAHFSTPVLQSHSFPEQPSPYDFRDPQEHLHGAVPVQQGYPTTWYPSASGLGVTLDDQSVPSSAPPPPHVVPSQRRR